MTVSRTAAALAAVGALTLTAACTTSSGNHPKPAPPGIIHPTPRPSNTSPGPGAAIAHAAGVAAQEAFDRYTSGDYAGAWETYTDEGRNTISKADFVAFNNQCPPKILHQKAKVEGVRLEDLSTAVARIQIGDTIAAYTLRYERNHWRVQPSAEALATWKLGVAKAVQKEKAAGTC